MFKFPACRHLPGRTLAWLRQGAVAAYFGCAVLSVTSMQESSAADAMTPGVSQNPLSAGGNVPGNLLLTPSVEFPTMDSVANLGNYDVARAYVGYFDADKCYQYWYEAEETNRHFYPTGSATSHACSGAWSGNFLNWAATQTIDPFRKALTGGYRVRDTVTETYLEKAKSDGNSSASYFPNRAITNNGTRVQGATPASWGNDFYTRIGRLGNKMLFTRSFGSGDGRLGNAGSNFTGTPTAYQGTAVHPLSEDDDTTVYEVSIRVKVCVTGYLEPNCAKYGSNYKPEGLLQQYATRIRYSAFGYLNDSSDSRDGGVLRAKQKFVGPTKLDPATGEWVSNDAQEWDPETGVFVRNPDSADATATSAAAGATISDSGVINYINKFGQLTTQNHKSFDPVSELYYTAIRYLKNQGNVSSYTSGLTYNLADGFPVVTSWDDPIQYACQNNAILGIGDVYTHRDKNLPGSGTSSAGEPSKPSEVSGDTTVDVRTATAKVAQLEGLTIDTASSSWTGRNNSAFIAGLAYDSHTKDMRPAMNGKQTVSTYWVDVRENQTLEPKARNQYWLAAKYGGFIVPENDPAYGFDPYARTTALDTDWWSSGQTLSTGDLRPENFYVASEADEMVASLKSAFAKIAEGPTGSASSLAANSTRLETGTRTFQAQFRSGSWSGELKAYSVSTAAATRGALSFLWNAGDELPAWGSREILVNVNGTLDQFEWANLTAAQQTALGSADIVNYLRGDRSKEESQENGKLRTRKSVMGDIVNSTPIYVGAPNSRLYATATFTGASLFNAFATTTAIRNRDPMVYVGANDGMLHAFDADTGEEAFAFVPATVIANGLRNYSAPDYSHRYSVDGEIAVAEIYDTRGTGAWKTVLVGTLGRGGPGVFALDITDPGSPALLWEKSGTDIPQLGKNIGRPVIAQVADGDWRVLLGNGPGASADSGRAQLVSIRLGSPSNGAVSTAIVPDTTANNGLTAVLARDTAGPDGFADTVYAGDLQGNLWKFSGISGTLTITKLFQARDPDGNVQPITAAPLVGRDPLTSGIWVFFGTGRYLHETDLNSSQVQTWYGLKDSGATISGRSNLVDRDITLETAVIADNPATPLVNEARPSLRTIEEGNTPEMASKDGWYIDLVSPTNGAEGERMVVPNRFQGSALIGTTRIPEQLDPCNPGGRGFIMAINPFTGGRLSSTFFDVNGDGLFNDADMVCDGSNCVPASGIGFGSSPNNPIFIEDVMQVGMDDGTTRVIRTQGSSVQARRMSWRELLSQ